MKLDKKYIREQVDLFNGEDSDEALFEFTERIARDAFMAGAEAQIIADIKSVREHAIPSATVEFPEVGE